MTIKYILQWQKFIKIIEDNKTTLGAFAKASGLTKQSLHYQKQRYKEGKRNGVTIKTSYKYLKGLFAMKIYNDGKAYEFDDIFKRVKIEYDVKIKRVAKAKEVVIK